MLHPLRYRAAAVAISCLFIATACGGQQPIPSGSPGGGASAGASGSGTSASPGQAELYGGDFVTTLNTDPRSLAAAIGFSELAIVGCKIQEGLISLDPTGVEPRAELAERWEISDDGLTYTFHIREGVTWHDGTPFTSADVKWSFENVNTNHPIGRQRTPRMAGIDTPDDRTVVFRLKEPWAPFMYTLGCPTGGAVAAKHTLPEGEEVLASEKFNRETIGTGPFKFEEWVAGERIVLGRNPNYWKSGLPYLDRIIFTIIPDATAMNLALRAGEVNYIEAQYTQLEDVVRLKDDPAFQVAEGQEGPATLQLRLNLRRPPLDQVDVRKALMMGLDRDLMLQNHYPVQGSSAKNMIDEHIQIFGGEVNADADLSKLYPYDPAKAEQLLDAAGHPRGPDGTRFKLSLLYEHPRFEWHEIAQVIESNWKAIGVDVTLEPVDTGVMVDRGFTKRDFDTFFHIVYSFGDPAVGVSRAFVCEDDAKPVAFGNSSGYCNPELDKMFAEAARGSSPDERRQIYQQIQEILATDLPALPLVTRVTATVTDRNFNYEPVLNSSWYMTGWESVHRIQN